LTEQSPSSSAFHPLKTSKGDTIGAMKKQLDSDSNVKYVTVQFYSNGHNSQFDCWIGLKFYMESPDLFSYTELKFQVNQSLRRLHNTGQQRLYDFCYLFPFNLWYLTMIFFLQGCDNWFWEFPSLAMIFNEQQHSFHVWYGFRINVKFLCCMEIIILSLL
jgi:hypothetical protein